MNKKLILAFILVLIIGCDDSIKRENNELKLKIEELNEKISTLESENVSCHDDLEKFQADFDRLESEYNDFKDESDRLIEVNYDNGYTDGWNDLRNQLQ